MSTPDEEWRALGQGTRRAARKHARNFQAHPDPAVSAVAARYARWYLDARTWHSRTQRLAVGLLIADGLAVAVALGWLSAGPAGGPAGGRPGALEKALVWLAAGMIALAILAPYAVRKVRLIRLCRLELANRLTAASAMAVAGAGTRPPEAAGRAPAAERDVSVRYDRRRIARQWMWIGVIAGCLLAELAAEWPSSAGMTPWFGVLCAGFVAFTLLAVVPQVTLWVRWVLPGRPVLELDAAGVHLPGIAYDLPWALLAEVRLIPVRYARRGAQGAMVVAFVPLDPAAALGAIRVGGRRRSRLERSLRVYGTPLSVCDNAIDHSGGQIAAAAAAFAAVPVRRY